MGNIPVTLVAQPLDPRYHAIGYRYTYRSYVFQVSQGIALYPPQSSYHSRVEGWQRILQLKLHSGGHRAIRGYRRSCAIEMGCILQYKWEACCYTHGRSTDSESLSSELRGTESTNWRHIAIQIGGILKFFFGK